MMVFIFAALLAALVLGALGWRRLAIASITLCLALAIWLFLFEIYSPEYGFGMPWIQL
ncbi:MAG: hypothetical protein U1F47_11790 [Hyphomicrobiales bacterium]|jgi:hypothetical protein